MGYAHGVIARGLRTVYERDPARLARCVGNDRRYQHRGQPDRAAYVRRTIQPVALQVQDCRSTRRNGVRVLLVRSELDCDTRGCTDCIGNELRNWHVHPVERRVVGRDGSAYVGFMVHYDDYDNELYRRGKQMNKDESKLLDIALDLVRAMTDAKAARARIEELVDRTREHDAKVASFGDLSKKANELAGWESRLKDSESGLNSREEAFRESVTKTSQALAARAAELDNKENALERREQALEAAIKGHNEQANMLNERSNELARQYDQLANDKRELDAKHREFSRKVQQARTLVS